MYVVAWFRTDGQDGDVFPNAFPDYDMAVDCVIHEIKHHHGDVIDELAPNRSLAGKTLFCHRDYVYVVRKMFNFNPKGM